MQSTKTVSVLRALAAPALFSCIVSCVNEDYDLNGDIDTSVDIYGDLSLPVGNTEFIPVGDFLELDSKESAVTTNEKGDYVLSLSGTPVVQTITIDPICISHEGIVQGGGFNADVNIKEEIRKVMGGVADSTPIPQIPGKTSVSLKMNNSSTDIIINENIEEESKYLKAVGDVSVNATAVIKFSLKNAAKGKLRIEKGMKLAFPECVSIRKSGFSDTYECKNNIVEFVKPVDISANPQNFELAIDKFSFKNLPENQGLINGHLIIDQPILLSDLTIFADASDFGKTVGELPAQSKLDIEINITSIDVNTVEAVVEPEITINQQIIAVGELPEFLTGENIVLDIYNPLIKLNVTNEVPVTASLNADIVPKFKDAPEGNTVHIGSADVNSEDALIVKQGYTDIYISRRGYEIPSESQSPDKNEPLNLIVENLSDIIKVIPDSISIKNILTDIPHKGNAETGYYPEDFVVVEFPEISRPVDYDFSLDYSISAPLAFGKDLNIEYYTDIKDWNDTFNPSGDETNMSLDIQEAKIKMDFINAIPLAMDVTAAPIDIKGNEMNSKDISVELNKTVKGGNLGNESITPLVIKMKATPDALKQFDGLRIKIVATSPDPDFQGVPLNEKQGIKLDNITARIQGGISTDLK